MLPPSSSLREWCWKGGIDIGREYGGGGGGGGGHVG